MILNVIQVKAQSWLDFLLSYMERWTLSMGGGGSDAGPSRRPVLDLNSPPEPELDLNQP
jgi:hypothetical protein